MKHKRIVVLVLFLLLVAGGIAEQICLARTFDTFASKLDALTGNDTIFTEQAPIDMDLVTQTRDWFYKKHIVLELTVSHRELNDICYVYGEMLGALYSEDFQTANQQLYRLKAMAAELNEMFAFRLGNLM